MVGFLLANPVESVAFAGILVEGGLQEVFELRPVYFSFSEGGGEDFLEFVAVSLGGGGMVFFHNGISGQSSGFGHKEKAIAV